MRVPEQHTRAAQARAVAELLPEWLEWLALAMLLVLAMPPLRNRLTGMTIKPTESRDPKAGTRINKNPDCGEVMHVPD